MKSLELGEGDDVVEAAVDARVCDMPRIDAVEVDVLAAGEIGVEAGAQLEQRGDPARA